MCGSEGGYGVGCKDVCTQEAAISGRQDLLQSDGARVVVHTFGKTGRPVVLAHAAGFHGLVWQPVITELGAAFRCVAPDLRGHGDSPSPACRDFDWRSLAADVLAVVEGLGFHRPAAIGHSSGATALLLAEQARPGTFAVLYCYEPIIVATERPLGRDPDSWLAEGARQRRDTFASSNEAFEHYRRKPPLSQLDPTVLRLYVHHGLEHTDAGILRLKCRPEDEATVYEMATAHDCFGRLSAVTCPVTVACGGQSEAFSRSHGQELVEALPRAHFEEKPSLGHLGPLERPDIVGQAARHALTPWR